MQKSQPKKQQKLPFQETERSTLQRHIFIIVFLFFSFVMSFQRFCIFSPFFEVYMFSLSNRDDHGHKFNLCVSYRASKKNMMKTTKKYAKFQNFRENMQKITKDTTNKNCRPSVLLYPCQHTNTGTAAFQLSFC